MNDFHVIIPARFNSTRLPGKLMLDIGGKTVIERVYQQALKAEPKSLIIATDSEEIAAHARAFGAEVIMTSPSHPSGTDRIAEVVAKKNFSPTDIIVNLQGDEPLIDPRLIKQVASLLQNTDSPVATLYWPLDCLKDLNNPNIVKLVRDKFNKAIYFSRAPIPVNRDHKESLSLAVKHIGIYAYRKEFLEKFVKWQACPLETCEAIEQLRILWNGYSIQVEQALSKPKQDINTQEDLIAARAMVVV